MNRNVTIVIIILVLVVIAGYLVWLRSRYQPPVMPSPEASVVVGPSVMATPTVAPSVSATPSATPKTKLKTATSGATIR